MILRCILLALSASLDALGLGITYGIKNTKMSKVSNVIIFTIVFVASSISVFIGHYISLLFSPTFSAFLGASLLIMLGVYNIYKAIYKVDNTANFDIDNSNDINNKEAAALGAAVAVDAACVSLGSGVIGYGTILLPILMATFHTFFVNCGNFVAKSVIEKISVPKHILSICSGILLILIGISRLSF